MSRRAWRDGVYGVIQAMTTPLPQGALTIERMCALAGVSRAGYYRHWAASAPRQEETGVRDAIQRLASGASALRLPPHRGATASRGVCGEPQAGCSA
jgi:hypothetical protein